jgi:hypothetical protein
MCLDGISKKKKNKKKGGRTQWRVPPLTTRVSGTEIPSFAGSKNLIPSHSHQKQAREKCNSKAKLERGLTSPDEVVKMQQAKLLQGRR